MKRILFLAPAVLLLAACQSDNGTSVAPAPQPPQSELNEAMVNAAFAQQAQNATVIERTLYSHYFQPGAATLNELGEQALATLLAGYRGGEGRIIVARGDVSDELFAARTQTVQQRLQDAGADAELVSIQQGGLPGGTGIGSAAVFNIMDNRERTRGQSWSGGTRNSRSGSGGSGGSGSSGSGGSSRGGSSSSSGGM